MAGCKREVAFEVGDAVKPQQLARYWQVPDFTLTERSGGAFRSADLQGKVWLADFFYTTCPGPCPALSSRLSELHRRFQGNASVAFVSISLDPEKDNPAVLQEYASRFGADARWSFLTGPKETIYGLSETGFKLAAVKEQQGAEPIIHSTKLVLVDQQGWIRGFYEGTSSERTEQLVRDIQQLLKENL